MFGGLFTFQEISAQLANLIGQLRRFDPLATATYIGALLTVPQFHANTLRLEALAHLAIIHCKATKSKPKARHLSRWLNSDLCRSPLTSSEDPPEDVFISNVFDEHGNYRIFEGCWEYNDFYLQQTLDIVSTLPNSQETNRLRKQIRALLRVSEHIASKRDLERYCLGKGAARGEIRIPHDDMLKRLAHSVTLGPYALKEIQVTLEDLKPFLFYPRHRQEMLTQRPFHTYLERHPLLVRENTIICALPTAISSAIRRFVLEWMSENGFKDIFSLNISQHETNLVLNYAMKSLEATPVDQAVHDHGYFTDATALFDHGKFAHLVIHHDDLADALRTGLSETRTFLEEEAQLLRDRITSVGKELSSRPEYSGGLTILVNGGMGRGLFFEHPHIASQWHIIDLSSPDLLLLARDSKTSLLHLWKLLQQEQDISTNNVTLINIGTMNLFQYWRDNDWKLIPRDFPYQQEKGVFGISPNFVARMRQGIRQSFDAHAAFLDTDSWLAVERQSNAWFFKEHGKLPAYVCMGRLLKQEMYGVVETPQRNWWIICDQKIPGSYQEFARLLWDAIFRWMLKASRIIEQHIKNLPQPALKIRLHLVDIEEWPALDAHTIAYTDRNACHTSMSGSELTLFVGFPFIGFLARPDNAGETHCLFRIIEILHSHFDPNAIPPSALEAKIVPSSGARFLHMLRANNFRNVLGTLFHQPPRFVMPEDLEHAKLGLAWLVRSPAVDDELRGKKECQDFLHKLALKAWERIKAQLVTLDKVSVVREALKNIEAVSLDDQRWETTAQAVLATCIDYTDALRAASDRDFERAAALLASRILVEMAACTCPEDGSGRPMSRADFDALLARILQLIEIGDYSDAVQLEYVPHEIKITPSGDLDIEKQFHDNVMAPRARTVSASGFESASQKYIQYFQQSEDRPSAEDTFDRSFLVAFEDEYRFPIETIFVFLGELQKWALENKQCVMHITRHWLLEHLRELPPSTAEAILRAFTLPRRSKWDEDDRPKDWFPWRYRRRLSLLSRPIVECPLANHDAYIISPGLLEDSIRYVVGGAYMGAFDHSYFGTKAMKSWIGQANDKRGHEFNEIVAERFRELGLMARTEVNIRSIAGANLRQDLGDVDVLAWCPTIGLVIAAECKSLHFAKTMGEVTEQLFRFRGQTDKNGKPDELGKHLRRIEWLEKNLGKVAHFLQLGDMAITLQGNLIFSNEVPMRYVGNLPINNSQILTLEEIDAQRLGVTGPRQEKHRKE